MTLYCFLVFGFPLMASFAQPTNFAALGKMYCSPNHARSKYTAPRPMIVALNDAEMGVNCMSLATYSLGARTRYADMPSAAKMVPTNGPVDLLAEFAYERVSQRHLNTIVVFLQF